MLSRTFLVLASALVVVSASPIANPAGPGGSPGGPGGSPGGPRSSPGGSGGSPGGFGGSPAGSGGSPAGSGGSPAGAGGNPGGPVSVPSTSTTLPAATITSSAPTSTSSAAGVVAAVTPTLPTAGDATELPVPTGTLERIALGHGIQNYSCTAAGATGTSVGALAVLYDITDLYSTLTVDAWAAVSVNILDNNDEPLNLVGNSVNAFAANVADPFPTSDSAVTVDGVAGSLTALGRHFFDASLVPTFDLTGAGLLFSGAKSGAIKAPTTADAGLLATGAVDWLQLTNSGASVGLTQAYRVVTAGGVAVACTAANETFSVPYAAQYWFYS